MRNKYRFPLQLRAYLRYWQKGKLNLIPREQVNAELLDESRPDASFLSLIVASCVIATLGLLANSAAVIIGAMIIAPLMLPIRGLAFGALEGDGLLVRRSLIAIGVGTVLALAISCGIGLLVQLPSFGSEILARSKPTLLDLGVAVAAGAISGYAKAEPRISGSLAGTAIAVALMPPICVIGLGLSQANGELSVGATLLYLTNLFGITLACMLTFVLNGYTPLKQAQRALGLTLTLTSVLVIPLTVSFSNLLQQSRLEASLKKALLNRTITFQQVQLVGIETNWLSSPPQVRLTVRTLQPITPKQVRLLEAFVKQQMGRPFHLIFYVSPVQEVTGEKAF